MNETTELAVQEGQNSRYELLDPGVMRKEITKIRAFQSAVRELLVKDYDYGTIPGCGNKPTLLKPGAESLAKMHGLADSYEEMSIIEDWDKPLFSYKIKCKLTHMNSGVQISEGIGECNSMEFKYRYRKIWENETKNYPSDVVLKKIKTGKGGTRYNDYYIPNEDIFSQINTILKMAKKRAMIDAVLSATRLSSVFTQDLEDLKQNDVIDVPAEPSVESKDDDTDFEPETPIKTTNEKIICEKCNKILNEKEISYCQKTGKIFCCYVCQRGGNKK